MPRLLLLVPTSTYRAAAFVRAARRLDVDITVASERPSSLARFLPIDLISLDFSDAAGCARRMADFAAGHRIDAVVGVDDQATLAAAAIAQRLSIPHNPVRAVYTTQNKLAMRRALAAAGVPGPTFRSVPVGAAPRETALQMSYPCVVKPLMMAASRGVIRVNNADEFARAVVRVVDIVRADDAPRDTAARSQLLVEDYVPGWEVAVEGLVSEGRLDVLAIFDKPDPLEGPYFPESIYVTPSRHPDDVQQQLRELTQDAVTALEIQHGPVHAEIRGDGRNLSFIEIAARSIGGYCSRVLRFEDGTSLEDAILRHALAHQASPPQRERAAAGVMMLQAPRSGLFRKTIGLDRARALDGIEEIIITARAGERLTPLPEGFLYAGFIFARGDTAAGVETTLREAYAALAFVIEDEPLAVSSNGTSP